MKASSATTTSTTRTTVSRPPGVVVEQTRSGGENGGGWDEEAEDYVTGASSKAGHQTRAIVTIVTVVLVLGILVYVGTRIADWTGNGVSPGAGKVTGVYNSADLAHAGAIAAVRGSVRAGVTASGTAAAAAATSVEFAHGVGDDPLAPQKRALHLRSGEMVRAADRAGKLAETKSLFLWFYSPRTSETCPLVTYASAGNNLWSLRALPTGRLQFAAFDRHGKESGTVTAQTTDVRDNEWHCVGFIEDEGANIRLYVDGVPVLVDVSGSPRAFVPARSQGEKVLLVHAQYGGGSGPGAVQAPCDHTGVGNLTAWSSRLTQIQASALAEPYEMVNPLQLITDRAQSLLTWLPLWDSDGNHAPDSRGEITNARVVRNNSKSDDSSAGTGAGAAASMDTLASSSTSSYNYGSAAHASSELMAGIKKGKLPPPPSVP